MPVGVQGVLLAEKWAGPGGEDTFARGLCDVPRGTRAEAAVAGRVVNQSLLLPCREPPAFTPVIARLETLLLKDQND